MAAVTLGGLSLSPAEPSDPQPSPEDKREGGGDAAAKHPELPIIPQRWRVWIFNPEKLDFGGSKVEAR